MCLEQIQDYVLVLEPSFDDSIVIETKFRRAAMKPSPVHAPSVHHTTVRVADLILTIVATGRCLLITCILHNVSPLKSSENGAGTAVGIALTHYVGVVSIYVSFPTLCVYDTSSTARVVAGRAEIERKSDR